ncbi:universal stress protein [Nonomuraea basaltis]|uniref:universal stress protein n=1 Tax=Nonomuraea basaltis TaxID=2495887 RepID=UPI0030B835B6
MDTSKYCAGALEAAADKARARSGDVQVSTEMLSGNVIDSLIGESVSAESLVLGSRGLGGFARMTLGGVGLAAAGHAAGPVVIVRGPGTAQHDQIVVGDDGSESSRQAMAYAIEQARARRARLHVVYALRMPMVSPAWPAYSPLLMASFQEEARTARGPPLGERRIPTS